MRLCLNRTFWPAPALLLLAASLTLPPHEAHAQQTSSPAGEGASKEWFSLHGEARIRYETVDGQFRAGGKGGDQAIAMRTLMLADPSRLVGR